MDRTTAPNSLDGAFVDTNVATGKPGTTLLARDLTAHQEEILSVIEGVGITPNSENLAQLLEGITRAVRIMTGPLAALAGWTEHDIGVGEALSSIVYGDDLFLIGTAEGRILSSTDGLSWVERTRLGEVAISGLGYGNGLYIAGTDNGEIYTSPNGEDWELKVSIESGQFEQIEYGNGLYVVASISGEVYTSTDGEEWNNVSLGFLITAITSGGGTFVIGTWHQDAQVAGLYASTDGVNWEHKVTPQDNEQIADLCYGNGRFIGFQSHGKSFYSKDGNSWSAGDTLEDRAGSVCFGRGFFFGSALDNQMYGSRDGSHWTKRALFEDHLGIYAFKMIYGRGMYIGLLSFGGIVTQFILGDDLV